jgi:hypothetical protein
MAIAGREPEAGPQGSAPKLGTGSWPAHRRPGDLAPPAGQLGRSPLGGIGKAGLRGLPANQGGGDSGLIRAPAGLSSRLRVTIAPHAGRHYWRTGPDSEMKLEVVKVRPSEAAKRRLLLQRAV